MVRVRSAEVVRRGLDGYRWRSHIKLGIIVLIAAVVGGMVLSVALYIRGAAIHRISIDVPPSTAKATATLDIQSIQKDYSELVGNLTVSPGPALLDTASNGLKEDLSVAVTSATTPVRRTWSKGMLPGVFAVPLTLTRDVGHWPFDHYYAGPITVEVFTGAGQIPERVSVTFIDRLPGWKVSVTGPNKASPFAPYLLDLQRTASTILFAAVILCILVVIASQGLFVAVQTLRGRRKFQSPMTTWYAAMLFAVVPLRNSLPGSPAFGSWIDLTIVLWVMVTLVISMLLYIAAWWRHLKPEPHAVAPEKHRAGDVTSTPR
jgi:hypothetical protein